MRDVIKYFIMAMVAIIFAFMAGESVAAIMVGAFVIAATVEEYLPRIPLTAETVGFIGYGIFLITCLFVFLFPASMATFGVGILITAALAVIADMLYNVYKYRKGRK